MGTSGRRLYVEGRLPSESWDRFEVGKGLLVVDGIVEAVASPEELRLQADEVVSLRGGYVVPGYCDGHVHVVGAELPNELDLYLRHGVTAIRDLGSPREQTAETVASVERGTRMGPRIRSYGELVDGAPSRWPEIAVVPTSQDEIVAHVEGCRRAGLAGVKFYHKLSPDFLRRGLEACRSNQLRSAGHLGHVVEVSDALAMGIDSIEHVSTLARDVIGSGSLREEDGRWHYLGPFQAWDRAVDLESSTIEKLIMRFVEAQTVLVPTLAVYHRLAFGDTASVTEAPELHQVPQQLITLWKQSFRDLDFDERAYSAARRGFDKMMRFLDRFHRAGGRLGVGTDAPNPFVVPGASLHDELALLVDAGIPTCDVVKMACRPLGAASGAETDAQGVIGGAKADFVVLDEDPFSSIQATRTIRAVVMRGEPVYGQLEPHG